MRLPVPMFSPAQRNPKTVAACINAGEPAFNLPFAHLLNDDEGIDRYYDIEQRHREELRILLLEDALKVAERNLIDWAFAAVATNPQSADLFSNHRSELAKLQRTTNIVIREKLVDLSLSLACRLNAG